MSQSFFNQVWQIGGSSAVVRLPKASLKLLLQISGKFDDFFDLSQNLGAALVSDLQHERKSSD
ncbi:MAG TPA: hypothetical protein VHG71_05255 [Verrucomicrobiae bacterium]|nr:hypothetical protein [Verrucomicrobiae bacterium]